MVPSDAERLEQLRLLWQGDAVIDIGPLWRDLLGETDDLEKLVDRIDAAGQRDAALECDAATLNAMRDLAGA